MFVKVLRVATVLLEVLRVLKVVNALRVPKVFN